MSRLQPLLLLATAFLAVTSAILLARLVDRQRVPRVELTEARRLALAQGAGEAIEGLGDPVVATYFVTPSAEMPSSMRRIERDVADALDAMGRTSGGLLRHEVLHVGVDPVVEKLATRYGARPFPVRTVLRDGHSEQSIHSSLVLASGARPSVTLNGITPEHAVRLRSLIVAHLERMASPRPPRIAIAAPSGHDDLRRWLERFGEVTAVDLDSAAASLPADADVLVWIQPESLDAQRVRDVELFLQQGRSIVIAASRRRAVPVDDFRRARIEPMPWVLDGLLDAFGVRAVDELLLDLPRSETRTPLPPGTAPLHMRNIGADQDFRLLSRHLSASLLMATPTPFVPAQAGVSRDGWSFETIATTSDGAVTLPWPTDVVDPAAIAALGLGGNPMPRAPLVGVLRPHDPWSGSLVLVGSPLPFADGILDRDGFGHRKFGEILVETLASPERLVAIDAWTAPAPPLPELASAARLGWRAASILPVPLLLLAVGVWRRAAGRPMMPRRLQARVSPVRALTPVVASVAVLLSVGVVAALAAAAGARIGLRADLTTTGSNSIAPQTLEIAAAAPPVTAELFATERHRLPPRLRGPAGELEALLSDLDARLEGFTLRVVRPESILTAVREQLAAQGIEEATFTDRDEEVTVVRRFTNVLRLRTEDGRTELLRFADETAFEHAEFRIAFALDRITTGRRPRIAVISDRPRPTPAEAQEYFQLQGLQPPMGTDVYALARESLTRHDFEVLTLDHREPVVPEDVDVLLWLQPRRPGQMLSDTLSRWLHRGRPAIVAAQHFNIQARLYPGRDNRVVYWPQPQWPDMQGGWFGAIGVALPRRVLFDELQLSGRGESQVMGRNERSFSEHDRSLPFMIRAVTGNFDRASPIVRGIGDQGFIWGSFIALDAPTLAQRGIGATPLITTSPRTWTAEWEGGFLAPELLAGPVASTAEPGGPPADFEGRLPLMVLLEGRFPIAAGAERDWVDPASIPLATPARLIVIGGSELFKDNHLRDPRFRGDHLLLNAVTALGADPRLLEILGRRAAPRGLDYVAPNDRLRWRGVVVSVPALALLLLGGGIFLVRRVPPRPLAGSVVRDLRPDDRGARGVDEVTP